MLWQTPPPGALTSAACTPLIKTRPAGTTRAITHGCGLVPGGTGIWKGQPAIESRSVAVMTAMPLTKTRVFVVCNAIFPPWGQLPEARTWTNGPGMAHPPLLDDERALVDRDHAGAQRDHR